MTQQFATIDRRTEVNLTPPPNRTHSTCNVMRKISDVIENRFVQSLSTEPASVKKIFQRFRESEDAEAFLRSLVESGLEYGVQVQEKNYQAINLTREQVHRTSCFDSLVCTLTLLLGIALSLVDMATSQRTRQPENQEASVTKQ